MILKVIFVLQRLFENTGVMHSSWFIIQGLKFTLNRSPIRVQRLNVPSEEAYQNISDSAKIDFKFFSKWECIQSYVSRMKYQNCPYDFYIHFINYHRNFSLFSPITSFSNINQRGFVTGWYDSIGSNALQQDRIFVSMGANWFSLHSRNANSEEAS